jgi:saccharopine dehydrogenase-like NADP-dependent oxidoreductase
MGKKVLVLGGGQMGKVIAQDLSKNYETKIRDLE